LLLLASTAGQVHSADAGLRAESRAGVSRSLESDAASPTADLRLRPMFAAGTGMRGLQVDGSYQPELLLRGSLGGGAALWYHRLASNLVARSRPRAPIFDVALRLSGGGVDFTNAAQDLEQPFGLGGAAGIVTLLNGSLGAGLRHQPNSRFGWDARVTLRGVSTPTTIASAPEELIDRDNPLYDVVGFLSTPGGQGRPPTPPQFLPRFDTEARYDLTRRDRVAAHVRAELTFPDLLSVTPRSVRTHPTTSGVTPWLGYQRRLTRNTTVYGDAGMMLGWQRTGLVIQQGEVVTLPRLRVGVRDDRGIGAGLGRLTVGALAYLAPTYDPFLLGLTERAALSGNAQWSLGAPWRLAANASWYGLVAAVIPERSLASRRDDHIFSGRARVFFDPHDNISFEAGLAGGVRVGAAVSGATAVAPQAMAYFAVTGGLGLDG
jgi:hypothetical protein